MEEPAHEKRAVRRRSGKADWPNHVRLSERQHGGCGATDPDFTPREQAAIWRATPDSDDHYVYAIAL
ncbi:hypothetical protein GGR16_005063 [Chelatococcus caeni]|uniref:Uncharacterized protein n=1 Tax=Chelatococcus caeni TaxID=1348468 RepID=A0A840C2B3_9HYPH|nr:hypothetical protein [Chelatococcus caeni]